MVNPINPNDSSQPLNGPHDPSKTTPPIHQPTETKKHDGMFMAFKKMFPTAKDQEIQQMVDCQIKAIGQQMATDEKNRKQNAEDNPDPTTQD